jgi:hypothetical protein
LLATNVEQCIFPLFTPESFNLVGQLQSVTLPD